jgi:VanZ family protein
MSDVKANTPYKILSYWFPVFLYCLLIFLQSSYPSPESVPDLPYIDKLLHIAVYAILGALLLRAFRSLQIKNNVKLVMLLSVLLSSLYGISDEIHQYFVPYRNADLTDVFANLIGSIIGVYIYQSLYMRWERKD